MGRKRKSPPRNIEQLLAKRMRDKLVTTLDPKIESYLIKNYEAKHSYLEKRLYTYFHSALFVQLLRPLKKFLKIYL